MADRRPPAMSLDDLGAYYVHDDGSVWRLVLFADRPTGSLENVESGMRVGGVIGAPIFAPFRRLVPEGDDG